jgi:hypothetical protein
MLPGGIYIAVITGTPEGARRTVGSQIDPVEALYRERFADAARLAHLLTGDPSIAEDLAQDAFERGRASDRVALPLVVPFVQASGAPAV